MYAPMILDGRLVRLRVESTEDGWELLFATDEETDEVFHLTSFDTEEANGVA